MYYKAYVKEIYGAIDKGIDEDYYRIIEIEGSNLDEILKLISKNSIFFKEYEIKISKLKNSVLNDNEKIIDITLEGGGEASLYGIIKNKEKGKRETKVIQSTDWI